MTLADWVNSRTKEHPWDQFQRLRPAIEALRAEFAKDDLKTLAQKGCGDCFPQDCVWPTCMSKGTP